MALHSGGVFRTRGKHDTPTHGNILRREPGGENEPKKGRTKIETQKIAIF